MSETVTNPTDRSLTTRVIAGWSSLDLLGTMQAAAPNTATVERKRVARADGSKYVLVDVEARTGHVVSTPERPGRIWTGINAMHPVEALHSLFSKGDVWLKATDRSIHEAMLKAAQVSMLGGEECRSLSRQVSHALEVRAGLTPPTAFEAI